MDFPRWKIWRIFGKMDWKKCSMKALINLSHLALLTTTSLRTPNLMSQLNQCPNLKSHSGKNGMTNRNNSGTSNTQTYKIWLAVKILMCLKNSIKMISKVVNKSSPSSSTFCQRPTLRSMLELELVESLRVCYRTILNT